MSAKSQSSPLVGGFDNSDSGTGIVSMKIFCVCSVRSERIERLKGRSRDSSLY